MELKFNSAICTSMEQSERLLALGLKKETADMVYKPHCHYPDEVINYYEATPMVEPIRKYVIADDIDFRYYIPAWSLHRLLSMLTYQVIYNGAKYEPVIALDGMAYRDVCSYDPIVGWSGDLYTDVIDCIKWLISIEQFNTEYLEHI